MSRLFTALGISLALAGTVGAPAAMAQPAAPTIPQAVSNARTPSANTGCGGHYDDQNPPSTIRVLIEETGQVVTVDFETYVKDVVPVEWFPSWAPESLNTGAIAAKEYAWYWANHSADRVAANGQCFDVYNHGDSSQEYRPGSHQPSTDAAVDRTWGIVARRGGVVIQTSYLANLGSSGNDPCGYLANGNTLSQWGSQNCALAGENYAQILTTYYSGVTIDGGQASAVTGVAVGTNADHRLEMFGRNPNGGVMTSYQTSPNGSFSPWVDLGGSNLVGGIGVGNNADGRSEIFVRNGNGGVMTSFQNAPNGGFGAWADLGGSNLVGTPAVIANADGRLELFVRNGNGGIMTAYQTSPNGGFSPWVDLGGLIVTDPVVGTNADGRLEIFARNGNGGVMTSFQNAPNGGFGGWVDLGGVNLVGDLGVGHNADGRLEIFARNGNGGVMTSFQGSPNGGFGAWADLGGSNLTGTPAVGANADDRLEVFVRNGNGGVMTSFQGSPNGGFGAWADLGGLIV